MVTDIRLDITFFSHPKIIKLQRRLGVDAILSLQKLWIFTALNKPDGILSNMDIEDIEIAAQWNGDFGLFVSVLLELKLIDKDSSNLVVHDWEEHNTWAAEAPDRSDKARFSKLASSYPSIHAKLREKGYTSISKKEYDVLTKGNKSTNRSTTYERTLNDSLKPVERNENERTTPFLSFPNPSFPDGDHKPANNPSQSVPTGEPPPDEAGGQAGMSHTEQALRECVAEKRDYLRETFPDADIDLELEELVAKYRGAAIGADPWLLVFRWFRRLKPGDRASPDAPGPGGGGVSEAERVREANKQACREFAGVSDAGCG